MPLLRKITWFQDIIEITFMNFLYLTFSFPDFTKLQDTKILNFSCPYYSLKVSVLAKDISLFVIGNHYNIIETLNCISCFFNC